MEVRFIGRHRVGIVDLSDKVIKDYAGEKIDVSKTDWAKGVKKSGIKAFESQGKLIYAPYSMQKLIDLEDKSEAVAGCMRAIREFSIMKIECKNKKVEQWFENGTFPDDDPISMLQEFVGNYKICGNGLLTKARNLKGDWMGFDRFIPDECVIVERYENNFPKPDYVQIRNNKRLPIENRDVIHIRQLTRKSLFWGLPKLSHIKDVYTISEIDTYNYNDFKNGLLIDYICFISGGTIRDNTVLDDDGNEVKGDAYAQLETALSNAQGSNAAHGLITVEFEGTDTKVVLQPLRKENDGGYLKLKEELNNGIYTYYGTPKRVVAQAISGELGGSNNSDMILFYYGTIKNIQRRLAIVLAKNFRDELKTDVSEDDFDFGNVIELFKTPDELLFDDTNKKNLGGLK